ncbi:hypothetical protein [Haloferula sp. BvORR071]|uniref:hypothetical protein n=1 Tax=Haloferula sp. BvORR071 TaxID=1396141 RepID=UPI0005583296|nr:hypothetical protein [Haloferula sp. BvORR071]
MIGLRSLFRLFALCALVGSAAAQVQVSLQVARRSFVAGESVPVTVSITNLSGQDLNFQGSKGAGWIDFTVTSSRGVPMSPFGDPAFGSMKVPLGQTMARSFDLRRLFSLTQRGDYSVYAVIRLPGQNRDGFMSNRVAFTLDSALPYWTQRIGVSGQSGREMRVLSYNNGSKNMLYSQVVDLKTGSPLQTHQLGEYLSFAKPSVTIDKKQVMHVLYLTGPTVWTHARISSDGAILGGELHKAPGGGNPVLMTAQDGSVQVGNSIVYDPKAEAEARSKVRKASDRPTAVYN